jgi:phage terminase large subunit
LTRLEGARKGPDSIRNGIDFIQGYKIIVHPQCVNFLTEIQNYIWKKDKYGKKTNEPIDDFNHLMDAMRYALEPYSIGSGWLI